ncbi:MAG: SBBP repeat-containing protein [Bryobacteraceae bacterium]
MRLTTVVVFLCAASASAWASGYGKLQLSFEANQGQTDARVQFLSRGHAQTLFLTSTEAVLRTGHDVFRMKLAGANPASKAEGAELRAGKSNYFIGNDPAKWRTGVAQYGRVRFAEVYRGIDLVYYGADGQLEYDWIVKPGADASKIRLQFDGVEKMRVDANGDLVLETASGEIREKKPVVYQAREIAGRYVIRGREAAFEVGPYDRGKQLVIDPVLAYSSYLGGSGNDWGTGIAVDSAGNAYVTGLTESTDFPLSHAFQSTNPPSTDESETSDDAFVAKVSADGSTLIYSTYIGGTGADSANAIAVDASGDAYITGTTESTDFPLSNAFQSKNLGVFGNSFVTKLNPAGSALLFSTYLGGDQSDVGYGIAVDTAGNAYITGNTNSDNFPLVNAIEGKTSADTFPSAFLTKMSADGSTLLYSTYLGGYKGQDIGYGVAVDSSGSAYVAGTTSAPDLPVVNALQAASKNSSDTGFVMKINPGGSAIVYSTYLGGSVIDHLYALAVDSSGNAYVTGSTNSTDFPTVNALEPSGGPGAFVSKINATGSALVWSTYLGRGSIGSGIAVNSAGEAWVTGSMPPTGFPVVNPLMTTNLNATFGSQFSADGKSLLFSSAFWIGSGSQGGIAVDSSGAVYVTGEVSVNDTSMATGFQPNFGGGQEDAYVLKIAGGPVAPSISGVSNGASFQPGIVPGSWATIQGSNLSSKTDEWTVVDGKLPTTVDDVSVTVGGQNAYVYYISAGQINFIVPEVPAGTQPVVVANSAGSSPAVNATVNTFGPAFFPWPDSQVVATRQDFSYAVKNGTFAGLTTAPAKPGDVIILWGTGFGPTNPMPGQGEQTPSSAIPFSTDTLPTVTVDNVSATVYGAALAPGFAGLYQVAIQVPASLGNGDWPVVAAIGGVSSPAGMVLTVAQ